MGSSAAKGDKFSRYRECRRHQGLRSLRMWVPDTRASSFQAEVDRQLALLKNAPEQTDALALHEAIEREDGWPR